MESAEYVSIGGRIRRLSHLEKMFYPEAAFRKRDLIEYYRKIGPVVLPHLKNRPFTLLRFPDGVQGESFHEKSCPFHRPSWVQTTLMDGVKYCVINDLPSLVWAANLAAVELHTVLATTADLGRPTMLVFDLDPGDGVGIGECASVALRLRELLESRGLASFPKTSGKKGLHLHVPLNTDVDYARSRNFAHHIAEETRRSLPARVTTNMAKKFRAGKVLIDWSQNSDFKSTVTVYSLRARETPGVAAPLLWKEVEKASKQDSAGKRLLRLTPKDVLEQVEKVGDLFENVLSLKQSLPSTRAEAA